MVTRIGKFESRIDSEKRDFEKKTSKKSPNHVWRGLAAKKK